MMWEIETDSSQWSENGMSAPYSHHNLRQYAENYDADPIHAGQIRLVVEAEGAPVGLVDLYDINPRNRTAFIGIYTMPSKRRRGFALRGVTLMERYARELLNLRIIAAKVAESNRPSLQLFAKSGYNHVGTMVHWLLQGSSSQGLLLYEKVF